MGTKPPGAMGTDDGGHRQAVESARNLFENNPTYNNVDKKKKQKSAVKKENVINESDRDVLVTLFNNSKNISLCELSDDMIVISSKETGEKYIIYKK